MTDIKPKLDPHSGEASNPMSFDEAYAQAEGAPATFYTSANGWIFQVVASLGQRGVHANERVLKFMSGKTERARAYAHCWGHKTNCKGQQIDLYSEAVLKIPAA